VSRVETYMDFPVSERWPWACLDPAAAGPEAAGQVTVWLYGQLRRYLEDRGFQGFFCRIGDEITPEDIPAYIRAAELARRGGESIVSPGGPGRTVNQG
jgi:hypothetical protein